ncbi:MAG: ABC transporter ATP-binding protein [Cellulosilyticaceae bacterium]
MGIILKNVSKVYGNGDVTTYALKSINLEIKDQEIMVILGPSGSGKSTLLNVISGLDTPTSGEIYFNERCISTLKSKDLTKFRRDYLGFIFQQYNLLQNLTVKENIEMGAAIGKNPMNTDEIMEAVGLHDKKDKYPYQLSGGEQQRVAIARSVAKNPAIMFCDEPTGALDEKTARQVLDLLQHMNEKYRTTTVIITHNPGIALMGDRILKMNSGAVQELIINTNKKRAGEISWG